MRVKLTDVFNTKYYYKSYILDLKYLFNSIVALKQNPAQQIHVLSPYVGDIFDSVRNGAPITIDLANCRLTPDCVACVMDGLKNGIDFEDSGDSARDAILHENMRRRQWVTESFTPLPEFEIGTLVNDYVRKLSPEVTYVIADTSDPAVYFPLAAIINMTRPSIKLSPGGWASRYITFVGSFFTEDYLSKYNEFFYATNLGVNRVKLNSDGKLYDQQLGYVSIGDALQIGSLVPAVFGEQKTFKDDGFNLLFQNCLKTLQAMSSKRKLTLKQFFE